MSSQLFSPTTSVSEALGTAEGAAAIFTSLHTACPGCYLARFCTLEDVASAYNLSLDQLLEKLSEAALAQQTTMTGAQHVEKV